MEARSEAQKVAAQAAAATLAPSRARRLAPALAASSHNPRRQQDEVSRGLRRLLPPRRLGRERTRDSRSDRKNPIPHHKKGSIGHLLAQYSLASPSSSYYPDPFKVSKSVIKIDAAFWLTNVLPSISVPWPVKSFSLALSNFFKKGSKTRLWRMVISWFYSKYNCTL